MVREESKTMGLGFVGYGGLGSPAGKLYFLCPQHGKKSRQFYTKHRDAALSVVARNFAAVLLHNAEADAQPKSRTSSYRLGGVKRIKNSVEFLDAWTAICK